MSGEIFFQTSNTHCLLTSDSQHTLTHQPFPPPPPFIRSPLRWGRDVKQVDMMEETRWRPRLLCVLPFLREYSEADLKTKDASCGSWPSNSAHRQPFHLCFLQCPLPVSLWTITNDVHSSFCHDSLSTKNIVPDAHGHIFLLDFCDVYCIDNGRVLLDLTEKLALKVWLLPYFSPKHGFLKEFPRQSFSWTELVTSTLWLWQRGKEQQNSLRVKPLHPWDSWKANHS